MMTDDSAVSSSLQQPQHPPQSHRRCPPMVTEAQLRWAQFHHPRRAAAVQVALERLYQTPNSFDNNSLSSSHSHSRSCSSSSHSNSSTEGDGELASPLLKKRKQQHRRRRRRSSRYPPESKGRRAWLRASQKRYEERRASILQHGYYHRRDIDEDVDENEDDFLSEVEDEEATSDSNKKKKKKKKSTTDTEEEDALLAAIFAGETTWLRKRRRRRRRRQPQSHSSHRKNNNKNHHINFGASTEDTLDRIRRFEAAFQSLLRLTTMTTTTPGAATMTPAASTSTTRIWKRTAAPADLDFTQWWQFANSQSRQRRRDSISFQSFSPLRRPIPPALVKNNTTDTSASTIMPSSPPREQQQQDSSVSATITTTTNANDANPPPPPHHYPPPYLPGSSVDSTGTNANDQQRPSTFRELVDRLQQQMSDEWKPPMISTTTTTTYASHPSPRIKMDETTTEEEMSNEMNPLSAARARLDKLFALAAATSDSSDSAGGNENDNEETEETRLTPTHNPNNEEEKKDDDNYELPLLAWVDSFVAELLHSSALIQDLECRQPGITQQLYLLYLQDDDDNDVDATQHYFHPSPVWKADALRHLELCALEYLETFGSTNKEGVDDDRNRQQQLLLLRTQQEQLGNRRVRDVIDQWETLWQEHQSRIWSVREDGTLLLQRPALAELLRIFVSSEFVAKAIAGMPRQQRNHGFDLQQGGVDANADEGESDNEEDPFDQLLLRQAFSPMVHDIHQGKDVDLNSSVELLMSSILELPEEDLVDTKSLVTNLMRNWITNHLFPVTTISSPSPTAAVSHVALGTDEQEEEVTQLLSNVDACPPEASPIPDVNAKHFAQEFVRLLHHVDDIEPLFTPDGLHINRSCLEKFVARHVQTSSSPYFGTNPPTHKQTKFLSPELLARARQQMNRKPIRRPNVERPAVLMTNENTRLFIQKLESQLESRITTEPASVNAMVLEEFVEEALCEVMALTLPPLSSNTSTEQSICAADRSELAKLPLSTDPLLDDLEDFVQPFVAHLEYHIREENADSSLGGQFTCLKEDFVRQLVNACLPPSVRSFSGTFTDCFVHSFMNSFRKSFDGVLDMEMLQNLTRTSANHALNEYATTLANMESTNDKKLSKETASQNKERRFTGRIADTVSKVSRIFNRYQQRHHQVEDTEEAMNAVAAFRQSRLSCEGADDTSSLSSYHVLNDFKKVMQTRRREINFSSVAEEEEKETIVESSSIPPESVALDDYPRSTLPIDFASTQYSPKRLRDFHELVKRKSSLFRQGETCRSIIDTDDSDASNSPMDPSTLASLLLSPTILTKRLQQAVRAVESRKWEQVSYLLSANPWLAEMLDLKTNQYLLHKLALFGSSVQGSYSLPPTTLNSDLIRMFPAAVHKFDQDGNLPLHMAAASANVTMIQLLGDRFPSGASVRNEDGMLPLHHVIHALASINSDNGFNSVELVQKVLGYFPGAVAVTDNDGNLPLHTAVSLLTNDVGVAVLHLLLDEADRQAQLGLSFRFVSRITESDNIGEEEADDSFAEISKEKCCLLARNEKGETPLMTAIRSRAGWKIIDALVSGKGGSEAVCSVDSELNNALHLVVMNHYRDPKAAMSILKVAPNAARMKNADDMIPFEIACRHGVPREVLLAILLVDLPFDLDDTACLGCDRDECGASWFFLTCECDDTYADIVEEVISLCSYPQARELCFYDTGLGAALLARATPKCRDIMQRSLRFLGRFEFVSATSEDTSAFRIFEALDFGTKSAPDQDGRLVLLKCYIDLDVFAQETHIVRKFNLDLTLLEDVALFAVGDDGMPTIGSASAKQYCVSIEQPSITLERVLDGLLASTDCRSVAAIRKRYTEKVLAILRIVAQGLRHLHSLDLVHGSITLVNCGKFQDRWKIRQVLEITESGNVFQRKPNLGAPEINDGSLIVAHPSLDVWAFGALAYEVLVGISFDGPDQEHVLRQSLVDAYVPVSGCDLILSCLAPDPNHRPSVSQVLSLPFWENCKL